MNQESIIELQKIDCNCNDCGYLLRDIYKKKHQDKIHESWHLADYKRELNQELFISYALRDNKLLAKAQAKRFQFKKPNYGYGFCKKFDLKPVEFIPATCQLENQNCFVHRKEINL
jgi:hypothetical protein